MAYRLTREETLGAGVRRIAHEQIEKALERLEQPEVEGVEESVHDVRKRCKKLRGLVRLVRPGLDGEYKRANVAFRDAARELSSLRDAHALLETFDELVAAHLDQLPSTGLSAVRQGLKARASAATAAVQPDDERIVRARDLILSGRSRIDDWELDDDADALKGGLAKTYKRGRKRLADSQEAATDEHLHQWRKRVKYSWYHARLLRNAAPSVLRSLAHRLHDLSDVLGDDHDLAVLTAQLRADPDAFGGAAGVEDTMVLIEGQRADLQRRALALGVRLYAEPASAYSDRMVGYWLVSREHGEELEAGEIGALSPPDDDLDELTKAELYERAQGDDLKGRSGMGRDELIAALRAAGASTG